jgi:hypothetical protein
MSENEAETGDSVSILHSGEMIDGKVVDRRKNLLGTTIYSVQYHDRSSQQDATEWLEAEKVYPVEPSPDKEAQADEKPQGNLSELFRGSNSQNRGDVLRAL